MAPSVGVGELSSYAPVLRGVGITEGAASISFKCIPQLLQLHQRFNRRHCLNSGVSLLSGGRAKVSDRYSFRQDRQ